MKFLLKSADHLFGIFGRDKIVSRNQVWATSAQNGLVVFRARVMR
jgi:hypothetical protein